MQIGDRVQLVSFNGQANSPVNVDPAENYWLLCGHHAVIVALTGAHPHPGRVLVQFEVSPDSLGLHCHNEAVDSLWILATDLVPN